VNRWFVVRTKPSSERVAEINLQRQGFRSYCPYIAAARTNVRRVPLFPRYLFVELDLEAALWRSVNGTFGVINLVQFGPKPSAVPAGVVEEIMSRENEDGLIMLQPEDPSLRAGDKVVLADGPLDQQFGVIIRLPGQRRAEVLLHLMGRQVKVTTPLSHVRVA